MDDTEVCGELNDYLSLPIEKVHDPIGWWWDHKAMYPKLSHMAFDYLSVPDMCIRSIMLTNQTATSTAVECLFLQGHQLLHFTRSCLSLAMIHSFLCFGDWSWKDLVDMCYIPFHSLDSDLFPIISNSKFKFPYFVIHDYARIF